MSGDGRLGGQDEESGLRWGVRMQLFPDPSKYWVWELWNNLALGQFLLTQRWREVWQRPAAWLALGNLSECMMGSYTVL